MTSVRVRVGPSPTGDPHVGTAYIAIFNMVFARQHGGQMVMRIEDTDRARSHPEWEEMILSSLRWLGVQWQEGPDVGGDFGPYRQSERGAIYRDHAEMLLSSGAAYKCFCTAERLQELRAEQREQKLKFGYDGRCRSLDADEVAKRAGAGEDFVVRLAIDDDDRTVVKDRLRGDIVFENAEIDDQVLLKSDGMPTYHLANVVDDHLMQITHVIRAEEWITSTPKHVLLYQAFDWQPPQWIHMPLLRNPDKSKISKRKNPISINYYRDAGFLPQAMLNYLGMMSWTFPGEREEFSLDEMVEAFDIDKVALGGPVFDVEKLKWLNGNYIRKLAPEDLAKRLQEQVFGPEVIGRLVPLLQERIERLEDFATQSSYFFCGEVTYDAAASAALVPKKRTPKEITTALKRVVEFIERQPTLVAASLEGDLRAIGDELGLKPRDFFMPIRVAVTGRKATPPLFDTMAAIGKERCRLRILGAIAHIRTLPKG